MSQKNPVFKKLAALTLSASVCTTAVGAQTPAKKKQSNNNIVKYTSCAIAAIIVAGTTTYLAWAKLFVNKVLTAAENLAKELNKESPDSEKVKKLSMEFYKLLHEAHGAPIEYEEQQSGNAFEEGNYENYGNTETCKQAALALIESEFDSLMSERIQNNPAAYARPIKVNRLRYVDRDKLKKDLGQHRVYRDKK